MFSKGNYYKSGSLVIELSLLMPGIISVMMFLIYVGLYFNDKCVIERAAYVSALRCASGYISDTLNVCNDATDLEIKTRVNEIFVDETKDLLIGKWDIDTLVDVTDDVIKIEVNGKMKWAGGFFLQYISDELLGVNVKESSHRINTE